MNLAKNRPIFSLVSILLVIILLVGMIASFATLTTHSKFLPEVNPPCEHSVGWYMDKTSNTYRSACSFCNRGLSIIAPVDKLRPYHEQDSNFYRAYWDARFPSVDPSVYWVEEENAWRVNCHENVAGMFVITGDATVSENCYIYISTYGSTWSKWRMNKGDLTFKGALYLEDGYSFFIRAVSDTGNAVDFDLKSVVISQEYDGELVDAVTLGEAGVFPSMSNGVYDLDGDGYWDKEEALEYGYDFCTNTNSLADPFLYDGSMFVRGSDLYYADKLVVKNAGIYRLGLFYHCYRVNDVANINVYDDNGNVVASFIRSQANESLPSYGLTTGSPSSYSVLWYDFGYIALETGEYTIGCSANGFVTFGAVTLLETSHHHTNGENCDFCN